MHREALVRRIEHANFVVNQRSEDQAGRTSPEFVRMNKEEIRMNRDILKTVKAEKKKGRLDNIY